MKLETSEDFATAAEYLSNLWQAMDRADYPWKMGTNIAEVSVYLRNRGYDMPIKEVFCTEGGVITFE